MLDQYSFLNVRILGAMHRRLGDLCDDASHVECIHNTLFAGVSDGAGSASRGGAGATIAVDTIFSVAHEWIPYFEPSERFMRSCAVHARQAIRSAAESNGCSIHDYACTLLIVAFNMHGVWALQVGDGAVVVEQCGGFRTATSPNHGSSVNMTYFVTDDYWQKHVQFVRVPKPVTGIAVFSDGIELQVLKGKEPHVPFFGPLFRRLEKESPLDVGNLLHCHFQSESMQRLTGDDITLVAAKLKAQP